MTGATLTTVATVSAARRSLALHQLLFPQPEPEPQPKPKPKPEPKPDPKPVPPKPKDSLRTQPIALPERTSLPL